MDDVPITANAVQMKDHTLDESKLVLSLILL